MRILKKYVGLMLSIVILFAVGYTSLHQYNHYVYENLHQSTLNHDEFNHDSHYDDFDCSLCDFLFSEVCGLSHANFQTLIVTSLFFNTEFVYNEFVTDNYIFYKSLRAPPVLV